MLIRITHSCLAASHSPEKEQRLLPYAKRMDGNAGDQFKPNKVDENQNAPPEKINKNPNGHPESNHKRMIQRLTGYDHRKIQEMVEKNMRRGRNPIMNFPGKEDFRAHYRRAILKPYLKKYERIFDKEALRAFLENIGIVGIGRVSENFPTADQKDFTYAEAKEHVREIINTNKNHYEWAESKFAEEFASRYKRDRLDESEVLAWINAQLKEKITALPPFPDYFNPEDFSAITLGQYMEEVLDMQEENVPYPQAFYVNNNITINADHAEARDEKEAPRILTHELAHFYLEQLEWQKPWLTRDVKNSITENTWNELKHLVDTIHKTDNFEDRDYIHEIIAIYLGGKKSPYSTEESNRNMKRQELVNLVEQLRITNKNNDTNNSLITLNRALKTIEQKMFDSEEGARSEFDEQYERMNKAVRERGEIEEFFEKKEVKTLIKDEEDSLESKVREMDAAADEETPKKIMKKEKEKPIISPDQLKNEIEGALDEINKLKEELPNIPLSRIRNSEGKIMQEKEIERNQGMKMMNGFLSDEAVNMIALKRFAEDLCKWDQGELSLEQKKEYANKWSFDSKESYNALSEGSNASSIAVADHASKKDRERVLEALQTAVNGVKKPLNNIKQLAEELKSDASSDTAEERSVGVMSYFRRVLGREGGMEYLCYYDILKICKMYKDAILESYHAQQNVVTARVAKQAAWTLDYVPWGKPVKQIINRQARSANQEETSKYLDYLEKEGFRFDEIFDNNGVLDQNRNNINRFKAVLEYAAEHAWLYDLKKGAYGVYDGHDVYGVNFEEEFGKETFRELVQKNEGGKKKEIDRGYERIDKDADVEPIMDILINELEEKNIYAAEGIMKRLQEKAKYAESNTWALVTLLNEAKYNNKILKVLDTGMIDNISNFTISQSAWSITWLKIQRGKIMEWKKSNDNSDTSFGNNIVTKTILQIEKRLKDSGFEFDEKTHKGRKKKNHEIAKILSCQTIRKGNKSISIFEDEFSEYRKEFREVTKSTSTEPGKTDDDYFNPANDSSDVLLLDKVQTAKILEKSSTGTWINTTKAPNFITQVFQRDDDLKKGGPTDAYKNFREEMHDKFEFWLKLTDTSRRQTFILDTDIQNRHIFSELYIREMITEKTFNTLRAQYKKQTEEDLPPEIVNRLPSKK